MATKKTTLISAEKDLKEFFGDLFDKTNIRIMQAARHGVSNAINALISETRQNVSGSYFRSSTSQHYSVPLIEGVRGYLYRGEATGFVDILGNRISNDGTWRLRFFEGGTKERINKRNRHSYGRLRPARFFAPVASSASNQAYSAIKDSITKAIDELNK